MDEGDGREINIQREEKCVCLRFCFYVVVFCLVLRRLFYDGFVVCCFGGFRPLFDNSLDMLYDSFPR